MRVLGIDPGTVIMGYGVVEGEDDEITMVDCGALTSPPRSPIGERLSFYTVGFWKLFYAISQRR